MPRRAQLGAYYHVLNRGNDRRTLFGQPTDYAAFIDLLREAGSRYVVGLLAYCLMPNHWHLIVKPENVPVLSAYMHWVTNAHIRRHLRPPGLVGLGHIYQGRYKSIAINDEQHLLTALRYVEGNASAASLVPCAEAWPWCSIGANRDHTWLGPWPMPRPSNWSALVNRDPRLDERNEPMHFE